MATPIKYTIELKDKLTTELSIYRTVENTDTVILVLPAMGVYASYYEPLCVALAQAGMHAATVDWRGNGTSNIRPSYDVDFGYEDLITDVTKVLFQLDKAFPQSHKMILGHSLGGQLGSLLMARHPLLVEKLFLVASCNVHYIGFGRQASRIRRSAKWMIPSLSTFFGHFPGKWVGFAGREAKGVMADWCHNALTGRYEPKNTDFDYEAALAKCTNPVFAISLEGDDMAPAEAVDNLLAKFKAQENLHMVVNADDFDIEELNHFRWVKNPHYVVQFVKERV